MLRSDILFKLQISPGDHAADQRLQFDEHDQLVRCQDNVLRLVLSVDFKLTTTLLLVVVAADEAHLP